MSTPNGAPGKFDDSALEASLSRGPAYVDDAGFSVQVLAKLPARRPQRDWRRVAVLAGSVVMGGALVALGPGWAAPVTVGGLGTVVPVAFLTLVAVAGWVGFELGTNE